MDGAAGDDFSAGSNRANDDDIAMGIDDRLAGADRLVDEQPSLRPFLHTWFTAPVVEEGRVTHVIVEDKSGRRAIRADYFGTLSLGKVQGYTSMILMFAMVGGPLFAGILADTTGSYRLGLTIVALLAMSGTVLFLLAKPPVAPEQRNPDAPLVSGAALTSG